MRPRASQPTSPTLAWIFAATIALNLLVASYVFWPPKPPGDTGMVATTVQLPDRTTIPCVLARDATNGSVSVAITCDWTTRQ